MLHVCSCSGHASVDSDMHSTLCGQDLKCGGQCLGSLATFALLQVTNRAARAIAAFEGRTQVRLCLQL